MPDPIRSIGLPPVRPLPPPPPAPAPPPPDSVATRIGDVAQAAARWRPNVSVDDLVSQVPTRKVFPWVLQRLDQLTDAMMAKRRATVAPPGSRIQNLGWDPATAYRYGDGSIQPPPGRPGATGPAGLANGASVLRFGADGQPANFTILDQGATNGCGSTSLAMMLNYFSASKDFSRERVDAAIRHYNLFSSPGDVAEYAERHGLQASIGTRLKIEDLTRLVDQGLPVQVLLDVSDPQDGTGLHYEVVTGHGTGPDGKRYLELANPWGQREYMAEDAFMARWAHLNAKGFPLGIDRVAIAMKPPGHPAKLPHDSRKDLIDTSMTALRVAQGLTQVTNGWARGDWPNLLGGVVKLVLGGVTAIPALLGHAGRTWAEGFFRDGRKQIDQGNPLVGVAKMAVGAVAWVPTIAIEGVGDVLNSAATLLATGVRGLGRGIASLFS